MILAFHVVIGAYGFWLPNDQRGSWSDFVASWELLRFGKATHTKSRKSLAAIPHDQAARLAAKAALKYPAVSFNGRQAVAIGNGFEQAIGESGYVIYACSILAEHVHLVIGRHKTDIKRIAGHFKGRATHHLIEEGLHPLEKFVGQDGTIPTPWGENCWKVFLDTDEDVRAAIEYVEQNPVKEGLRAQLWSFLTTYKGRPPLFGIDPQIIFRSAGSAI